MRASPPRLYLTVDAAGNVIPRQKLRRTAAGRQVLCVTHLAPIAAHASHHLVVDKRVTRGATRTSVTALDEAGRVEEIARMLAGAEITAEARAAAERLIKAAG